MAAQMELDASDKPVVNIRNLTFAYETGGRKNINGLNCVIPPNAKVILVGANGAGKSTLLRILTGVIYLGLEHDEFDINGNATPHDQANGGIEPFSMDIAARDMMKKWQAENLERRDELVRVLGINLDWRMHECSGGQRKKVRIMLKLLRPFRLCVIDEFAADLDIFSRKRFFDYLTRECAARGASVVYATHIFDQADVWATHVAFMQLDKVLSPIHALATYAPYREILARTGADRAFCPMYVLVLEELERQYRDHSDFFTDDNQCLTDVIMASQAAEKEADAGERLDEEEQRLRGGPPRAPSPSTTDEHRKERRAAEARRGREAQRVVA
ncbi:ABC transporter [Aureococcus anophagefferens]|nr:ABC transporter [Aureococcus anophagefferens]